MALVLDASVAVAWIMGEEPIADVEGFITKVLEHTARVPGIWRIEVANALLSKVTKRNDGSVILEGWLERLRKLPVGMDELTHARAWSRTVWLAWKHGLSTYDASYLELAIRIDATLLTLDGDMARAGAREGVVVLTA